ncbi:MAG: tyrosine-type recombinase/integrase [Trueperella sp.]|uniref:tyrosine-type recombinase/integrase n=1 Tax=Trueperella sp. TaxID=2699835 RepID=UPI002A9174AC|nr:tyrosine-type recombinase/integrase [Trueperella sp.]MDY5403831.1 tyrosine-type recombinase/integrase [Trueperella sp.]
MATLKPYRHKDGTVSWRVRFRLTPNTNPVSETFDTHDAAQQFIDLIDTVGPIEARRIRDATTDHPHGLTLADALDQYLEHVRAHVSAATPAKYMQRAQTSWLPLLGHYPIQAITRTHVTQWLTHQRHTPTYKGTPPSTKTLKDQHGVLSSVLQHQVNLGNLPANVAKGVHIPRDTTPPTRPVYLTRDQYQHITDTIDPHYQLLVMFLYATGTRFNEATALTPADMHLTTTPATVDIVRTWKDNPTGGRYLGTPKTKKGVRTITLPATLVNALTPHISHLHPDDFVFTHTSGKPLSTAAFRKSWLHATEGMIPRPRVHDLRHTHASELIHAGVPLPVIQARLGHESIQTTVDTYGHLSADAGNLAATAIDNALTTQ